MTAPAGEPGGPRPPQPYQGEYIEELSEQSREEGVWGHKSPDETDYTVAGVTGGTAPAPKPKRSSRRASSAEPTGE
jgi:hypothetical protein